MLQTSDRKFEQVQVVTPSALVFDDELGETRV